MSWLISRRGLVSARVGPFFWLVLPLLAINAASASGHIYWTSFSVPGSIGRANLDGTGATESFIRGRGDEAPIAVATHGRYIYWTNDGADGKGSIGRANLDGTDVNQNFITGATGPAGLAIEGKHIYWTNHYLIPRAENPYGSIGRANLNGTHVNQAFITATVLPRGIAVDDKYIYWANDWAHGTIGRANLSGTGINQQFMTGLQTHFAAGLAVALRGREPFTVRDVYWTVDHGQQESGSIYRVTSGVGGSLHLIADAPRPVAVAVNDRHVYWANDKDAGSIGRANLDGSEVDRTFLTGMVDPLGVAVDGR